MERIGLAAIEDDAIYFALTDVADGEAGAEGTIGAWDELSCIAVPPEGHSTAFIESSIREYFAPMRTAQQLRCVGISTFGLVDLQHRTLLEVPRWDWQGKSERLDFRKLFPDLPLYVGHDSSTAAIGEWLMRRAEQPEWRAGEAFVHIRVGAGVGVGCVNRNGTIRRGRSHPEAGHLPVRHANGELPGTCRLHSRAEWDCIEGMISEKALLQRSGATQLTGISSKDPVWSTVARHLALLVCAVTTLIAPDMVSIGGRTMIDRNGRLRSSVLTKIRAAFADMTGQYPRYDSTEDLETFIQRPRAMPTPASASLGGMAELVRQDLFWGTVHDRFGRRMQSR